ncbi:CPBP family intramembrane glutamic endopeptidase [Virgibacillus halophilus]|uniref:CPBP family intramembrane glutamic endopeptidase n=1 Tax=Tigheibacillus halophilus TaxID=361280 RepID=UPI003637F062
MRKKTRALYWILALIGLLQLPYFIPAGTRSLMEWQRENLNWNYIGIAANYFLFAIYAGWSGKNLGCFGVHAGLWKQWIRWYALLTGLFLFTTRGIAFFTEGPLGFQIPLWTTVFFQLIYVAFGEELFWRGFIQSEFGIWIASIGFGFIHFLPGVVWHVMLGADFNMLWGLGQMIFAIAIGFLFGWVRNKTDSVYACVLLHGIYNLSNHLFVPL